VRGASALGELLRSRRDPSLRLIVVWEPVLRSDRAAGEPIADARASRFWDGARCVSRALAARDFPVNEIADEKVVWDLVAIWPPGTRFADAPVLKRRPVIQAIAAVRAFLDGTR
jgi:hypothetical protein